jgi:hypothetical protein
VAAPRTILRHRIRQLEQRQLSKIRTWADANLAAPRPTMFYMFSGPDFLYANAFYSKATTYVLSALEPVGFGARSHEIAARRPRLGALQCRTFAGFDPELQLLHHQADEGRPAGRRAQRHLADPVCFPGALGKDHPRRQPGGARRQGAACISPTKMPARTPRGACGSCSPAATARKRRCIIFQHRSFQQRRQEQRLPEILRDAGARQQPDQERVLSAARRQFHHRARFLLANSATIIQDDSGIPLAITIRRNGGSFRSAATPVRSPNSPAATSRPMPSCSSAASRWISASAIAGGRMNRTCCCRSGCHRTVRARGTRRRRRRRTVTEARAPKRPRPPSADPRAVSNTAPGFCPIVLARRIAVQPTAFGSPANGLARDDKSCGAGVVSKLSLKIGRPR